MTTSIHQVRVSPTEGGNPGWTATCQNRTCTWRRHRGTRLEADQEALDHQRSKVRPDPADQINDLDLAADLREWVSS